MMNETMKVPCECGQSTVKRYPGRYCGPNRKGCSRKVKGTDDPIHTLDEVWVDGNNTFHHTKSHIPKP